jgi:tRNA dimethylallyltransferase
LEGEISFVRAVELIKRNTRHYAKRQLTWFKKDKRINWFDIKDFCELDQIAEKIIQSLN